jgi:hypothetical protein
MLGRRVLQQDGGLIWPVFAGFRAIWWSAVLVGASGWVRAVNEPRDTRLQLSENLEDIVDCASRVGLNRLTAPQLAVYEHAYDVRTGSGSRDHVMQPGQQPLGLRSASLPTSAGHFDHDTVTLLFDRDAGDRPLRHLSALRRCVRGYCPQVKRERTGTLRHRQRDR